MNAADLMTTVICSADAEATLGEASTLMSKQGVGSALVLEGARIVGILTERDILRALSTAHDAATRPVAEWMTRNPVTAPPDTPAKEALRLMVDGGFRHLPIVDEGRTVGMLSMRDIARALAD